MFLDFVETLYTFIIYLFIYLLIYFYSNIQFSIRTELILTES